MSKYNELMNRIEVSPDMRSRLLSNITAQMADQEGARENIRHAADAKTLANAEQSAQAERRTYGRRIRKISVIIVPIVAVAAVAVLALILGPRVFDKRAASSGSAALSAYDSAKAADSAAEETMAMAAGGEMAGDADNGPMEEAIMEATPPEAAEAEDENAAAVTAERMEIMAETVLYENHHIPLEGVSYPSATLISGSEQLKSSFMAAQGADVVSAQPYLSQDECAQFTDEFFEAKDLIVILIEEGSGSISHTLDRIERDSDQSPWRIYIERTVPEVQTDDMAYWYLIAAVDKGEFGDFAAEIIFEQP